MPWRRRSREPPQVEHGLSASLLEQLADAVIACDAKGSTLTFNRRAREIFGPPAGPVSHEDCAEHFGIHVPGDERHMPVADLPLARALRGERVRDMVVEVRPRRGEARIVSVSGERVTGGWGRTLGAVVVCRDITAARESVLRLRVSILEHLPHGIVVTRAHDGEIVYLNASAAELLGFRADELVGRSMWVLNVGTNLDPRERGAAILDALSTEGVWRGDVQHARKDGSTMSCSVVVSRLEDPDRGDLWISSYVDGVDAPDV